MITNTPSGTNIHEIAAGIYRINTPVSIPGAGQFNFNQYLIKDKEPLLFHTGPRRMFTLIKEAINHVLPAETLRHIGVSHFEADECGALNEFLKIATEAQPVCSRIGAMVSLSDYADRPPLTLSDGEELSLGEHKIQWFDTPHIPHGWDCGLMIDSTTQTFFCGDLFTQGGSGDIALTESDILEPSEAFRKPLDYFSHAPETQTVLERLAQQEPSTLACMHGSAWHGNGAALLRALAEKLM